MFSNSRWLETEWRLGYSDEHGYESDILGGMRWEKSMVHAVCGI
jgi:hypothetical protein